MFVTKRVPRKRTFIVILFAAVLVFAIAMVPKGQTTKMTTTLSGHEYSLKAETNSQRLSFLQQFGWSAKQNAVEVEEIKIPMEFNAVYENYNQIQLEQGLDLSKYKGKECIRYSYEITNYPNEASNVRANIIVLNDSIIGGDVCSIELGGFMHGFEKTLEESEN